MDCAAVLGGIFAVHVLAIISPGPNVLIVTQTSMSRSRREGVATALGIAVGAALWSGSVALGLSMVFAHFAWLYGGLKLLGGAYLIYLGIRLWIGAGQALPVLESRRATSHGDWPAFRIGLITNLTNPKAAIFYASVFSAFLVPDLPVWVKYAAVGIIFTNSAGWHVAFACFFSTQRAQQIYGRFKSWIDRAAGAALAALGLTLIFRVNAAAGAERI